MPNTLEISLHSQSMMMAPVHCSSQSRNGPCKSGQTRPLNVSIFWHRTLFLVVSDVIMLSRAQWRTRAGREVGVLWHGGRCLLQAGEVLVLWLGDHLGQDVSVISPLREPYQQHQHRPRPVFHSKQPRVSSFYYHLKHLKRPIQLTFHALNCLT